MHFSPYFYIEQQLHLKLNSQNIMGGVFRFLIQAVLEHDGLFCTSCPLLPKRCTVMIDYHVSHTLLEQQIHLSKPVFSLPNDLHASFVGAPPLGLLVLRTCPAPACQIKLMPPCSTNPQLKDPERCITLSSTQAADTVLPPLDVALTDRCAVRS